MIVFLYLSENTGKKTSIVAENPYRNVREPIGRIAGNISRMYLSRLHRNLAHLDLERGYYTLLLIEAGGGKMIQKELAELLSCNKVQVVRTIDYLVSNGYVRRGKDPGDQRKWNLELTGKAERHLPEIRMAIEETTSATLRGIPDNIIEEIYSNLKQIEKNLASEKTFRKR
jgi:DNA-binding MarR family transcriptional regulator